MKAQRNPSKSNRKLPTEIRGSNKKTSVKSLVAISSKNLVRNSYENSFSNENIQSEPTIPNVNTSINIDSKASNMKLVKYAPKINIDLQSTSTPNTISSKTLRKASPSDKKSGLVNSIVNNPMYNSLNKEIKIATRNKILKGTNSPNLIKGGNNANLNSITTESSKRNMRYNSNSYSSSFCQNIVSSVNKEKLLIDGSSIEVDSKHDFKKSVIEPYNKSKPSVKTINNTKVKNNINQTGSSRFQSQSRRLTEEIDAPFQMSNYIELFDRINKLLIQTKEEVNSFNNGKFINSTQLIENVTKLIADVEEIYNRQKQIFMKDNAPNSSEEESYESTKFNLNLIKSSSERRDSIYRKFFDICIENLKDITTIISTSNIAPSQQPIIPVNLQQNITNNIINNHNSNSNNVNVNVNVNVNTINNVKNLSSKEFNQLKKMSRMISRKKMSKHQFHIQEEDAVDLSESMMCEGVAVKMPVNIYHVNKPKEDQMNYKVFTEGDLYDSDDSDDVNVHSESEIFVDSFEDDDLEDKKFKRFRKNRSKSLLNLKKQRDLDFDGEKKKKNEIITLFQNISISKIDIDDSEDSEDDVKDVQVDKPNMSNKNTVNNSNTVKSMNTFNSNHNSSSISSARGISSNTYPNININANTTTNSTNVKSEGNLANSCNPANNTDPVPNKKEEKSCVIF